MADEKRQLIMDILARAKTKKGIDEAAGDLDKLGHAADNADKKTEALGKTSKKTEESAQKLGKGLDEAGQRAKKLDDEIANVNKELTTLANSFSDASEASERLDISKAIRRTENELRRLTKVKNLLPDPEPEAKSWVSKLGGTITSGLGTVGQMIASNKYLVAGISAAIVTAGPVISGLLSAAVVGGAGLGGIIGGIALAANSDAKIQTYASQIATRFTKEIQSSAQSNFSGVIMESLGKLDLMANKASHAIDRVFKAVAPSVGPLVDSLLAASEILGKSFVNAAEKSGPVLAQLGKFAEATAGQVGGFLDMLADHTDAAVVSLELLSDVLGLTVTVVSSVVEAFFGIIDASVAVGEALGHTIGWIKEHIFQMDAQTATMTIANKGTKELAGAHEDAAAAAQKQKDAEQALTNQLRAETDPAFGLLEALKGVREAQANAAEAAKKHGANSDQAREATRKLAEAAINLQSAAGKAGGAMDGTLSPSLRRTLQAAGLTKSQMDAVERELRAARQAAQAYAKTYTATITTVYNKAYQQTGAGKSRYPDERAAGGPIVRDKPYLVGENGPEIVVPESSGRVLNAAASRGMMATAGMKGGSSAYLPSPPAGMNGGGVARLEVVGGADLGVAALINYLIRTDKIQIRVSAE